MKLAQEFVEAIVQELLSGIEPDERQGVEGKFNLDQINAELATLDDPDSVDVAEAIWNALEDADELDEDAVGQMADIFDRRWEELECRQPWK